VCSTAPTLALAAFYAEVLGMTVNEDSDDWVVIGAEPGARDLAFQRASPWTPLLPPPRPTNTGLDPRAPGRGRSERLASSIRSAR
jgi:hypothetical protein